MKKLLLPLLLLVSLTAHAQDTIRVCTWNLTDYSIPNEDDRAPKYKLILEQIMPDILVCQDMVSADAVQYFLLNALPSGKTYAASSFNNGPDTDNSLFYNSDKVALLEAAYYPSGPDGSYRDIADYKVQIKNTGDTLHILSAHLKAGDTKADELTRADQADSIAKYLKLLNRERCLVVGDFNFYSGSEPGYDNLVKDPTSHSAVLYDVCAGVFEHEGTINQSDFTQSTRLTPDAGCGGGVGGGLDDRFDMVLYTNDLKGKMIADGVMGNDSKDRRNAAINDPPNIVSKELADALFCASDHLPVRFGFLFGVPTSVPDLVTLPFSISPVPAQDLVNINYTGVNAILTITDALGREIPLPAASSPGRMEINVSGLVPGMYWCRLLIGKETFVRKLVVVR